MKNNIIGLILAAGYSSRMGSFKPLLPIGDKTAIGYLIDTFTESGLAGVYIVTGFNNKELTGLIKTKGAEEIYNDCFEKGMFSSIQTGVKSVNSINSREIKGLILGLADCPLVSEKTIKLMLGTANNKEGQEKGFPDDFFIIPCYQGKKGHPIYIPRKYFQEIMNYNGSLGLKGFMNQYKSKIVYFETMDEAVLFDMDDKAGYAEMLDFYHREKIETREKEGDFSLLKNALGSKRLFLIRHCQQVQMGEKIFLGQQDPPLSEEGRILAQKIGENLAKYKTNTNKIYSSDLKRATETAEVIKEVLTEINPEVGIRIIPKKEFRELNLGSWDGKPIREIKKHFPKEYMERGGDLIGYRIDPLSENFYDLQYRAIKELKKVLIDTNEDDIIIVTHSGVINVILSKFNNTGLEEQLKSKLERGAIYMVQNRKDQ